MDTRKFIILILINLIFVLIQTAFFSEFFGNELNPNLILALSYSLLFANLNDLAFVSGLIGGLFLDLLGVGYVGISSFIICLLLVFSHYVRKYFFKGWQPQVMFVILSHIVYAVVVNFQFTNVKSLNAGVFIGSMFTMLLSLLLYLLNINVLKLFSATELKISGRN